jgi:hypothetical protein
MKLSPFPPSKPFRRRLWRETVPLLIACLAAAAQLTACKAAHVPSRDAASASLPQAQHNMQSGNERASRPVAQANSGATQPSALAAQLMRANGLGESVALRPGATTDLILSATWCGACKQLDHVLRDPAIAPYLRGRSLVFVFLNEHLMKGAPPEASEDPGDLRSYLLHPEGIRNLPGPAYLLTDPPAGSVQFPTVLTANGSMGGFEWLMKDLGVPEETLALVLSRGSGHS